MPAAHTPERCIGGTIKAMLGSSNMQLREGEYENAPIVARLLVGVGWCSACYSWPWHYLGLGWRGAGTYSSLVQIIQNFNVSASGQLGGYGLARAK